MKLIYRLFSGLRDMYMSGKAVFILMLLGIFASDIVLIYCYSMTMPSEEDGVGDGITARLYEAPNVNGLTAADVKTLDLGEFEDDISCRGLFDLRAGVGGADFGVDDYEYPYIINKEGEKIMFTQYGGRDGEALYSCENVAALLGDEADIVTEHGIGSLKNAPDGIIMRYNDYTKDLAYDEETDSYGTAVFDGRSYRIVGISVYDPDFASVIPWNVYLEEGFQPEYFVFVTSRILSHSENERFCELIESQLGKSEESNFYFHHPYHRYDAFASYRQDYYAIIFLLYLVSLVTLVFYTNYFTERMQRRNAVCHVCGASKSALVQTLVFGITAVSVPCFFAAFAAYSLLSSFAGITVIGGIIYSGVEILYMFLSAVAAPLILTVPAVIKIYRLSAAELCRASS